MVWKTVLTVSAICLAVLFVGCSGNISKDIRDAKELAGEVEDVAEKVDDLTSDDEAGGVVNDSENDPTVPAVNGQVLASGVLEGPADSAVFSVNSSDKMAEIIFDYTDDDHGDFFVNITCPENNFVRDYELQKGMYLPIHGAGVYNVVVTTKVKGGGWTAKYHVKGTPVK